MANLKEVRERITSVISTQQITKAMKMVSAAKLRKAQGAIQQLRPYSEKLNSMLSNILSNLGADASTSFGQERKVQKACIVLVTSNRGLCGAFNTNLVKTAVQLVEGKYAEQRAAGNLTILFIGKKGYDYFRRRYTDIHFVTDHLALFENLSFEHTVKVSNQLMKAFETKQYDAIDIVYARFRNAGMQYFVAEPFLPVPKMEPAPSAEGKQLRADFLFEPSQETLLENLVPTILQTQFQKTLLDTHASEHGARMTAMDKASENAEELLKELRINYNKARQEAITKELAEIVGGAASLGG
jgi:F-type H+-transporting ATPase subunit gamma